jgi:DNA-directed RNA polymerase subunit RPC12/RpoP
MTPTKFKTLPGDRQPMRFVHSRDLPGKSPFWCLSCRKKTKATSEGQNDLVLRCATCGRQGVVIRIG